MGCGESHFQLLFARHDKKDGKNSDSEEEGIEEQVFGGGGPLVSSKSVANLVEEGNKADKRESTRGSDDNMEEETVEEEDNADERILSSSPLHANRDITRSQLEFFQMLDERIENGPDYIPNEERLVDIARIRCFLTTWEKAAKKDGIKSEVKTEIVASRSEEDAPTPPRIGRNARERYFLSETQHSVVNYDQTKGKCCTELA